jgi:hypothetical protein
MNKMKKKTLTNWPPNDESFTGLSKVKKQILEILWPMEWVGTHDIHQATGQSYYDRRIRELRESGWQIETDGLKYRLKSRKKLPGNSREYPSAIQKREVFTRDKGLCQICGSTHPRMEYDHKVPRERFGVTEVANLQLLCSPCNVDKRGVCKKCTLKTCDGCPYAYPELFKGRFVLLADNMTSDLVEEEAAKQGITKSAFILKVLQQHLRKR